MATITDITTGLQTVSSTGAVTGTLDISGLSGDWTIKVQVAALSSGKTVVLAIEDTVNSFTNSVQHYIVECTGPITNVADRVYTITKKDAPALRLGTASATVRLNCLSATSSPGLQVRAWLEQ